jgi:SAM-dependent methyltransferase
VTAAYDDIGRGYREHRCPDRRLAAAIWDALGDARSVINVGAGAGSYEPPDRDVLAVEPSAVMLAQRPKRAARAVQAAAESLPVADRSFDVAMAVLTMQHWSDVERGVAELLRVTRSRIVIVTMDVEKLGDLWMVRDYLPEMRARHAAAFPSIAFLERALPGVTVSPLPVPHDCTDRFLAALWARPELLLDAHVRRATSAWQGIPTEVVDRALAALRSDLASGRWDERHHDLRNRARLDVGLRLVSAAPRCRR